jgi:hypothetical protein
MSPLLFVLGPVIVGGVGFVAILLGALAAGSWESWEGHRPAKSNEGPSIGSNVDARHIRAA